MRGTIHHIDLTVSDLMVSAAFYELVLGFLGYRRTSTRPDYVDWNLPGGDGLLCSIGDHPRSANRISSIRCRVLCRVLCRSGWAQA